MANTFDEIHRLVDKLLAGEIVLPDIQREYVWYGSQIPRFLDSLRNSWPIGSFLLWDTRLDVPTKAAAVVQKSNPAVKPAVLLDGQQRLTTLARIFAPASTPPGERTLDVRYNPTNQEFRNANAIEKKNPAWISVSQFVRADAQHRDVIRKAGIASGDAEEDALTDHLKDVALAIRQYSVPIQTIEVDDYEQVAEIFNRVNTGGRRLSKGDLVMGSLAARWPGGRHRVEAFEEELRGQGWGINREVLLRVLSVLVMANPNHVRLVGLKETEKWEEGWGKTEDAIRHAVAFFVADAEVPNLRLLPTDYMLLLPAILMHRQRGVLMPGQAKVLRQWVYLGSAFGHYSGSLDTRLASDLNLLEEIGEGDFQPLLYAVQAPRTPWARITAQDLLGKKLPSPLLKVMQLLALQSGAQSWWSHRALSYASPSPAALEIEVHHIFPKAWLRRHGLADHPERDTLANFAFLSRYDNTKISDSDPLEYLSKATPEELEDQWVPQDPELWRPERFTDFCLRRRELLAGALNEMLGLATAPADDEAELPDEVDQPETGAWAEEMADDPEVIQFAR